MTELDFLIPKQIQVGSSAFGDGHVVDVVTDMSEAGLTIVLQVREHGIVKILASADSVPVESSVWNKLEDLGRVAGKKLDLEMARKKFLTTG